MKTSRINSWGLCWSMLPMCRDRAFAVSVGVGGMTLGSVGEGEHVGRGCNTLEGHGQARPRSDQTVTKNAARCVRVGSVGTAGAVPVALRLAPAPGEVTRGPSPASAGVAPKARFSGAIPV